MRSLRLLVLLVLAVLVGALSTPAVAAPLAGETDVDTSTPGQVALTVHTSAPWVSARLVVVRNGQVEATGPTVWAPVSADTHAAGSRWSRGASTPP